MSGVQARLSATISSPGQDREPVPEVHRGTRVVLGDQHLVELLAWPDAHDLLAAVGGEGLREVLVRRHPVVPELLPFHEADAGPGAG